MRPSSEKRLQQLHPALAVAVRAVAAMLVDRGIVVEVVQGLRTYAEQDALFAQGRTKPGQIVTQARGGQSNHNFGLAADLCPFVAGQPDWNAPIDVWMAIGTAAQAHGLEWGGQWKKFLDKPHVQLPGLTVDQCARLFETGGLAAVWEKVATPQERTPTKTAQRKATARTTARKGTGRMTRGRTGRRRRD